MSLKIQIAHPNDFDSKPWRVVGTVATYEEVQDVIASPDFEYSYGTILLVHRGVDLLYAGAYGNSEFVKINKSLFKQWPFGLSAPATLVTLLPMVSRQMMARLGCACARSSPMGAAMTFAEKDVMSAIEQWAIGKGEEKQIYKERGYLQNIDFTVMTEEIYYRLSLVNDSIPYHDNVIAAIRNLRDSSANGYEADVSMMNGMRRSVPFYDVIDDIIKRKSLPEWK